MTLAMRPAPGERLLRFVGDTVPFELSGENPPTGARGYLRTNLGCGRGLREEIVAHYRHERPLAGVAWQDLPMLGSGGRWQINVPLIEPGYFRAKAYMVDRRGRQHWPAGADAGIAVHPDEYRTGNIIYCAFARLFGESKSAVQLREDGWENQLKTLEKRGYTVIPPSGTLRDLCRAVPHIIDTLGCRIVQLLPINPTPTTYARMGRFGSPYAALDFNLIDPALVEFDHKTTGIEQFCELTYAVHARGGRLFLDIVTNHTGWSSTLHELHPDWFVRKETGEFASPGAWGVTWEDLVELDHRVPDSWEVLARVFLTWCHRGVDGFRCDAGYKVPLRAWQYITARVRQEFPDTIFLLEGLGGAWDLSDALLGEGGMQWAYSELFQNFTPEQISGYLDHSLPQSERVGVLVHYSETHDNERLAARGRAWSLLRNQLCALSATHGGFGFTCGVEWLAPERILVHQNSGLAWDTADNLLAELRVLTELLREHPCFFDGARCVRLSAAHSPVLALSRESADGADSLLILINTDLQQAQSISIPRKIIEPLGDAFVNLCGGALPKPLAQPDGAVSFRIAAGGCCCLAPNREPRGLGGAAYRTARARSAWALKALACHVTIGEIRSWDWRRAAELLDRGPVEYATALSYLKSSPGSRAPSEILGRLEGGRAEAGYPPVVRWTASEADCATILPVNHWLLLEDNARFRATLKTRDWMSVEESVPAAGRFIAGFFCAPSWSGNAKLIIERYDSDDRSSEAMIYFAGSNNRVPTWFTPEDLAPAIPPGIPMPSLFEELNAPVTLLTNGIGGMARFGIDLGRIKSKYDCLLGANLDPAMPVDRHIFVKRMRAWVNADGFITPLNLACLQRFRPPATWSFVAGAGNGRAVELQLEIAMVPESNTTVVRWHRPSTAPAVGKPLPESADVRVTVRFDIEDRNFHTETRRNGGAEHHFTQHCRRLTGQPGFLFTPVPGRQLRVFGASGEYIHEAEWCEGIPHPVESSRGQPGQGDAFSPGWFDLPMRRGDYVTLVATADPQVTDIEAVSGGFRPAAPALKAEGGRDPFSDVLRASAHAFVVRRQKEKTIIAGYPWFLDWGRDSLICARGLLESGRAEEVRELLITFGRFEEGGTLPNTIHGDDVSNRDTSDAPLWYAVVCEETARVIGAGLFEITVEPRRRRIADVLRDIALRYMSGTRNGICMDKESALIWSPKHFTWMDTNYPAGTPREGYPVEIQALWIRTLRLLAAIDPVNGDEWNGLAQRAEKSLLAHFWLPHRGYFADVLLAPAGMSAARATPDQALRCNFLLAISLGIVNGRDAQRGVEAARRHLVVPGAVRSLAPLEATPSLRIHAADGRLLNNPQWPYFGRYEGDEDTRRKPAYHNGTAWVWMLPVFCEALARAWDFSPKATSAARSYLRTVDTLLWRNCLGHLPEVLDGDAPHQQRGCDAQAWSATETLRVWQLLNRKRDRGTEGPRNAEGRGGGTDQPRNTRNRRKGS